MEDKDVFKPVLAKNDGKAYWIIAIFSIVIFIAITVLAEFKIYFHLGFDAHIFAKINAVINFTVSILLPVGIYMAKNKKYILHRKIMFAAIILSSLFLISYVLHHLLTPSTYYPKNAGNIKYFYYVILSTHIILAGIVLPFVLLTSYRALTADFLQHKKMAKLTFPIWWYVSITGVIVYLMISPYY